MRKDEKTNPTVLRGNMFRAETGVFRPNALFAPLGCFFSPE